VLPSHFPHWYYAAKAAPFGAEGSQRLLSCRGLASEPTHPGHEQKGADARHEQQAEAGLRQALHRIGGNLDVDVVDVFLAGLELEVGIDENDRCCVLRHSGARPLQ